MRRNEEEEEEEELFGNDSGSFRTSFGYHSGSIFESFLRLAGQMEPDRVWKATGPF